MPGESQQPPKNEPDPTVVTTENIDKAVGHLRAEVEAWLEGRDDLLRERDLRYTERFNGQELAVKAAFDSSEKAISKAEVSIEKRADATYVSLQELSRSLAALMPRSEAESRIQAMADQVTDLKTRLDTAQGKGIGASATAGYFLAAATIVVSVVVVLANFLAR